MNDYFENSEIFENFDDEMFSNIVDVGAIVQGAGAITQGAGQVAQASATKQASKLEITKEIETICGKRRGGKKKKASYDKCALPIYEKYKLDKEQQNQIEQQQLRNASIQVEQNKKSSQRNTYIGIGVVILLVGAIIYFKRKS